MYAPIIAGSEVASGSRETCHIINPATGLKLDSFICANLDDADQAAQEAGHAFEVWSNTPALERAQYLKEIATEVHLNSEALARQITLEQGKPLSEAKLEISGVVAIFEHFAELAARLDFSEDKSTEGDQRHLDHVPVGPAIVITTWNFPVETAAVHLAPALASGCTTVVLANSETPTSVAMLIQVIHQTDLPKGVVNLLMGASEVLSERLIRHPAMRHLSYTGSVRVGRVLAAQCGAQIMRCTLELGGNAPAIVLPGTDLAKAVDALIGKRFWNAGQVCTAPNRIYVNREQHDAFAELATSYAQTLVVGDGMETNTTMGPLANEDRVRAMERIASDAVTQGASPLLNTPRTPNEGFFSPPRVFANVPDTALGMKEEIFGPIACIAPYDDLQNVITRANDCDLALSGYVFGPDQKDALAVATQLQVGSVAVNQPTTAYIDAPFGGMKQSGLGVVGGKAAIQEYLFPRLTASGSNS